MPKPGFVYIMTNKSNRVLYTGVSADLYVRVVQHKQHTVPGFTARYNCTKLVYFECFGEIMLAVAREKQIKNYSRAHKIRLIVAKNPSWRDMSEDF